MSPGQTQALRELERLCFAARDYLEILDPPHVEDGHLWIRISLRLGPVETRPGGLDLHEREEFFLHVPVDFPFDRPTLTVEHKRFAGFPHVIWSKSICLYQSALEWNPADGLFGFFERLKLWLTRAALNDMDPVGGPLEPPHHITDFSQVPFVIRASAPVPPGQTWVGLAELRKHANRIELLGWNDLSVEWQAERKPALAVILPDALPMEFPKRGSDFFDELSKQEIDRYRVLRYLALAAEITESGDPIHLVIGLPMRRAVDGTPRLHIAVWTLDESYARLLRASLPKLSDSMELLNLRQEFADALYSVFKTQSISWCRVLEDRDEIVVRRDACTPISNVLGKRVLILGCGAIGSWCAEMIARANPSTLHVLDHSIVKPGLIVRQNFTNDDIGLSKADALAQRLRAVVRDCHIESVTRDAHFYLTGTPTCIDDYDIIVDCTASHIFQMKLERDWDAIAGRNPQIISLVTDAKARHCLMVVVPARATAGIWNAYVHLKYAMCCRGGSQDIINAFNAPSASSELFQPEPGCSDPTFAGSMADVVSIGATALNLGLGEAGAVGMGFTAHSRESLSRAADVFHTPVVLQVGAGQYRVHIATSVLSQARAAARQNGRIRTPLHETGGLLWGLWNDAVQAIWVWDASGPPPDSLHDPGHFECGVQGTKAEHEHRMKRSHGACGFVGFWHTHPDMPSQQSLTDMVNMSALVAGMGHNQRRSLMIIFGRTHERPTAGVFVYESASYGSTSELVSVGAAQLALETPVV